MIELREVSKVFRRGSDEVKAIADVTMNIADGEYVAIRGHSGSGKSTLLSLVGGLATPTSGTVTVGGTEISSLNAGQRARWRQRQVGFVFQMFHLLPYLSVRDNVLAGAASSDLEVRADELLMDFGLEHRLKHRPGQLSAGERQRVAMARALINRPSLLLADEPTGNLDPENATGMLDLLDKFHQSGGTIMLVTHSETAAERAQRALTLTHGALATAAV